jgi:hypothetical protein
LEKDKHAIARRRVEPLSDQQVIDEAKKLIAWLPNVSNIDKIVRGWLGTSNTLSLRICQQLGYDVQSEAGYGKFRDNCLTCHGGYRQEVESDAAEFAKGQPGISCNYCHQVGDDSRWVMAHGLRDNRETWRALTPAAKSRGGMRDLVTTSKQASLCLDCHIGNRAENKFVTHEMYAAGHPPLPSIELQTFCEQMPQHWRSLSEAHDAMPAGLRESYFSLNFPGVPNPDTTYWNTRKLLVGALVAHAKTLDLMIETQAMDEWGDYALYDCAACHHELETSSRRQQRGYPAAPGRPRLPEWAHLQLMHIGSYLVEDQAGIMGLESELVERVGEIPFGAGQRVSGSARQLRERLSAAVDDAERKPVDEKVAVGVLRGLAQTPGKRLLTYDAARQVVWAMQTVAAEMKAQGAALDPNIDRMIAQLSEPQVGDGRTGIETELPAGRDRFIYEKGLQADLNRRNAFDSSVLESRLRAINALLSGTASSDPK